ncbi:MAG: HD domain-containing protein [Gemmatimonadaceae bacterium]
MPISGYSDPINHALAFAAKHHDQQVRKGLSAPYLTQPANVALILTRYGREEDTVVAGILYDVIEDFARDGYTREMLEPRIVEKFGSGVLQTALSVTPRKFDDEGVELDAEEQRADFLRRLQDAGEDARWVCAADKLHNAATILSDLRRTVEPETVWSRATGGRDTVRWYARVADRLRDVGFDAPILDELAAIVAELDVLGRQ